MFDSILNISLAIAALSNSKIIFIVILFFSHVIDSDNQKEITE